MWQRFTERARKVILLGQEEAQRTGSARVDTEHLLLGLVREAEGAAAQVLNKMGVNWDKVREAIESEVAPSPPEPPSAEPKLTPRCKRVLELAADEARRMKHNYIGTEHLLLALLREKDGVAARVLRKFNLTLEKVRQEVMEYLGPENPQPQSKGRFSTPALDAFGHDLTRLAAEGRFDPVVGRDAEVQRVLEILCRRSRSNALLIGKIGVGRAAIAQGVVLRIVGKQVPPELEKARVVHLDVPSLMLGVKDWSEVEQRVRNLLKEIQQSRPVIFLDDVQGLGSREIAALHAIFVHATRGELSCIATTTPEGYERMGEESALRRLFQVVWVPEPTPEQTLAILQTLRPRYEEFHKVTIGDSMVTAIVEGAQSFSGTLPEKAIDVLDEACARVKVHAATPPPEVASLMREIESVRAEKDHAINNDEYERAAELRDRQMELEQRLQQKLKEGASAVLPQPTVTEEVVAQVIAERMSAQQKPGA